MINRPACLQPLLGFQQTYRLAVAAKQPNVIAATAGYAWWQLHLSKMLLRYRSFL